MVTKMQILDNTNYKFERKFTDCDTYQVKITTELLEELENCQNVNTVDLKITGSSGTLTIPSSKSKKSKVFDLNIDPISRGERESFEVNAFKSSKRVESLGSLQVRLSVQATSKVYDMTKKKITEVEDESRKHCAKELKLEKFSNNKGLAYKVMKNKEARKSEVNSANLRANTVIQNSNEKPIDKNDFTIRQKVLHLLAVKPLNKDALLLRLQRLKVTSSDRSEVDRCLSQLATLNKENMYQLSNQFIPEIRDDWIHYNDEERRKVAKLKSDSKNMISNRIIPSTQTSKYPIRPITPDSHENTRPKAPQAPHSSKTKIAALDMMAKGIHFNEISKILNVPENLLISWKSQEFQIRQNFENSKKQSDLPPLNNDFNQRENNNNISPANADIKFNAMPHNIDEDSNSSFKTHTSHDEGFVSGDKRSPLVNLSHQKTLKRRSVHLDNSNSTDKPDTKKLHISMKNLPQISSHNDAQSSSSCEVTPKSDISQSSLQNKQKPDKKNQFKTKNNSNIIYEVQNQFNAAFEEYSKLCEKIKICESEIEDLRNQCKNESVDYSKLYKLAKLQLAKMESPQFQSLTARVNKLESEMFDYLKILNNVQVQ